MIRGICILKFPVKVSPWICPKICVHSKTAVLNPQSVPVCKICSSVRSFACMWAFQLARGICCCILHHQSFVNTNKLQVYSSSQGCHTATGTHMPHGITQCYLPPGRGDIPVLTQAEAGTRLSDPGGMQG